MIERIPKEGCPMKKLIASLLFVTCVLFAVSGLAQTVTCPSAGVMLTLPDSFA